MSLRCWTLRTNTTRLHAYLLNSGIRDIVTSIQQVTCKMTVWFNPVSPPLVNWPLLQDSRTQPDRHDAALYPSESNHLVGIEGLMTPKSRFLVARGSDGQALGCGAILLRGDAGTETAELKRMWVDPAARGSGLGRRLLDALQAAAIQEGATVIRLETGISQPEAIGLYRAAGFSECGPFGNYVADPLSIFMEKAVDG
jgi:putative acetyltransferase